MCHIKTLIKCFDKCYKFSLFKNWLKKEINLELIYRASRDGWESNIFHQKCDKLGTKIVVIRSEFDRIFGGYASSSWDSSERWKNGKNGFVFSLTSRYVLEIRKDGYKYAMRCHPSFGPIFGDDDIIICDNSNASNCSSSNLKSYNTYPPLL